MVHWLLQCVALRSFVSGWRFAAFVFILVSWGKTLRVAEYCLRVVLKLMWRGAPPQRVIRIVAAFW